MIDGTTRTIGEAQGYLPLPVRDVILYDAASGQNVPAMQTWWQPSKEELNRLRAGQPILLTVLGLGHPPVMMDVEHPEPLVIDGEFEVLS